MHRQIVRLTYGHISYHLITSPWSAFLLMSFSCSLSGLVQ